MDGGDAGAATQRGRISGARGGKKLLFNSFAYHYRWPLARGEDHWKRNNPGAGSKCPGSAKTITTEDGLAATFSSKRSRGPDPSASLEVAHIRRTLEAEALANATNTIRAAAAHALKIASEFPLARRQS